MNDHVLMVAHGREWSGSALDGKASVSFGVEILRGETSVQEDARKHALTVAEFEQWTDRFLLGTENALV